MKRSLCPVLLLALTAAACGGEAMSEEEFADTNEAFTLRPVVRVPPSFPRRICGLHLANQSPAPFTFDGGNAAGWQVDGIYNGGTTTRPVSLSAPSGWWDRTNYDRPEGTDPVDGRGALLMLAHPQYGAVNTTGFWRVDWISPELGEPWQLKRSFTYELLDEITFANPPLFAQFLLKVQKCDGSVVYLYEATPNGQPAFCQLRQDHQWTSCTANLPFGSNVDKVLNLVVRIFVPHGHAYEGGIYLDEVRAL